MANQPELVQVLQQLLTRFDKQDQINELVVSRLEHPEAQTNHLAASLATFSSTLETVVTVQYKMPDQMQLTHKEQQQVNRDQRTFNERQEQFNARQERFNERQEETDAILLSELREIKADLRELKNVVLTDHEERLRRLEEFMRRAS